MLIVGAGLSGLIAAQHWRQAKIVEAASEPAERHKALLRFRSDAVSRLTGIKFKSVTVRKGIFMDGRFVDPSIRVSNLYSIKCLGKIIGNRSIWDTDTVTRYIAPENFYDQLIDLARWRISWGEEYPFEDAVKESDAVVSTAPMPIVLTSLNKTIPVTFNRAPIYVQRFRVNDCAEAYQTIYFPEYGVYCYRASITGDILIVESTTPVPEEMMDYICGAFGFGFDRCTRLGDVNRQSFGKIEDIDRALRRKIIAELSLENNIYSLGRFGCWRNILLDDVVDDINQIDRLIEGDLFSKRIIAS